MTTVLDRCRPCACGENTRYADVIEAALAAGLDPGPCILAPLHPGGGRTTVWCDGHTMSLSRAVWVRAFGDPGQLWVLHTCGQGRQGCVRLAHLYLGSPQHNIEDAVVAGAFRWRERRTVA
jgi:hypothetical protein